MDMPAMPRNTLMRLLRIPNSLCFRGGNLWNREPDHKLDRFHYLTKYCISPRMQ